MSELKEGNQYVIITDQSAGNDSVGEMWQETKVFDGTSTLDEVMMWAMVTTPEDLQWRHSQKRVTITKPHV